MRRHYGDDVLIAYSDGELSSFRRRAVRRHLQTCWQCRAKLDELEHQILAVARLVDIDPFPGSERIAEGRSRFWVRASALTSPPTLRVLACSHRFPFRLAWAASLVIALVGIGWIWLGSRGAKVGRALTPREGMARVVQAESALLRDPVHQQFRIVAAQIKPIPRQREGRLEVWYQPEREQFASRLQDQRGTLRHALWQPAPGREYVYDGSKESGVVLVAGNVRHRASLDWLLQDGLALKDLERGFLKWLENRSWKPVSLSSDLALMVDERGTVLSMETLPGGSGFRLIARKTRGAVTIACMIDVDGWTFRPRLQKISYQTPQALLELQLIPERVQAVSLASFEPDPSLIKPVLPPFDGRALPLKPFALPSAKWFVIRDATEVEVRVLNALHRVRACLGEPVEVIRQADGTILVRAVLATLQRKREVQAALAEVEDPSLSIDIKSTDEALQEVGENRVRVTVSTAHRTPPLLHEQLKRHFSGQGVDADAAAERFSEDAISLSEESLAEVWALRRLAERFGVGQQRDLSPASRELLATMCLDHLVELRAKARRTRQFLGPVLSAISGIDPTPETASGPASSEASWDVALLPVFDRAKRVHNLVLALFGSGPMPVEAGAPIRDLLAGLQEMDTCLRAAAESVPLSLSGRDQLGLRQRQESREP